MGVWDVELKCHQHRLCVVRGKAGRGGCCVATVGHLQSTERCAALEDFPVLVAEAQMMRYMYTSTRSASGTEKDKDL